MPALGLFFRIEVETERSTRWGCYAADEWMRGGFFKRVFLDLSKENIVMGLVASSIFLFKDT